MGGKSAQTIGYRYRHLLFEIWAQHADTLHRVVAGGKRAWSGCVHENQTIQIDAPAIWGDDEDNGEGGMVGPMDVQFGLATQPVNARMTTILGPRQTGNRGFFSTVFEGIFGSYIPNPKTRAALLERINAGWPGGVAWYPAKAPIPLQPGGGGSTNYLLVTGAAAVAANAPSWAGAIAEAPPIFTGHTVASGADVNTDAFPAYYNGTYAAVSSSQSAIRYRNGETGPWSSGAITWPAGQSIHHFIGGHAGWLIIGGPSGTPAIQFAAPGSPSAFSAYTADPTGGGTIFGAAYTGGAYYISQQWLLWKSETLAPGSWVLIYDDPSPLQYFVDICEHEGALYACVGNNFYSNRWEVRRSKDGGATWPDLIVTEVSGGAHIPFQLCSGGGVLVAYCLGGGVWTSANGWSAWVDTGLIGPPGGVGYGGPPSFARGRQIVFAGSRFFVIGYDDGVSRFDGDKVVTSEDTLGWSAPALLPMSNAFGIAGTGAAVVLAGCPINAMNPAHIIRYMLTQKKQIPDAMLSEASFTYAADVLFAEGFGLCEEFDPDQETPEAFILRICDIIGACCTQSKTDGLIYLDLLRNDYIKANLPVLTDDDIVDWQDEQAVPAELTNSVQIGWRDVLVDSGLERITPPIKALGHIRTHGREMNQVIDMRGIPFEGIALRVAKRELDARSKPLVRLSPSTLRKHTSLRPGQPLLINCPKRGRADMVVRVGEVDHGTPTDARMRWVLLQDVFDLPATVEIDPTTVHEGSTPPAEADAEIALEAPYVELVATLTTEQMAALGEEAGYLLTGVSAPTRGTNYGIYSKLPSEAYDRRGFADFSPTALTVAASLPLDGSVQLVGGNLLDRVAVGSWALWDDEIIRVDGVTGAGLLTTGRGCADTVPAAHAAGSRIFFVGDWNGTDRREYAKGDVLAVKLPVRTGPEEQPLAGKTELSLTFAQRQCRPYPPGNLLINGQPFYASGAVVVSPPGGGGGGAGGGGVPVAPPPPGSDAPNTGNPLTDPGYSATWQEQGAPPDGYLGEPYYLIADGRDDYVFKGTTTAAVTKGGFTTNVGAANGTSSGSGDNGLRIRGIPLTAHTANAAASYNSNLAPAQPHGGNVTDSITYAAKPAYSLPNWMKRGEAWGVGMVDTTPPWTTMRLWGDGGALESRAESNSGTVRAEFTIAGITTSYRVQVGVVVADPDGPATRGTISQSWMPNVQSDGTYAVEVNATTGVIHLRNSAGTSIANTTMAVGAKVYRFRFGGQQSGVTIKANFGNEAWVIAPTAEYTGLPNTATVVPVQWDGLSNTTYQISSDGGYGPATNASGVLSGNGIGLLLGSVGQSSGQHRVRFHDASRTDNQRVGLCLTGQTGQLGSTGTSIGYRNSNTSERWHELRWTWGDGGVATLPAGFDTAEEGLVHSRPTDVVFAYDATAAEIKVWIAEQDQYNVMRALRFWTTITGVPAGTYWPALYAAFQGRANLYHDATQPAGYIDWIEVVP